MLNPLCCISPRIGVFVFAIIDLIISAPLAWNSIAALLNNTFRWNSLLDTVLCVVLFLLALTLLLGAIQRSTENIRLWLGAWTTFLVAWTIIYIFQIVSSTTVYWVTGFGLGMILIFLFEVWVVYAFLAELKQGASEYSSLDEV